MVRTKIEINVSALGQRTKTMSMTVGSNTTTADVIHKVLEKYCIEEPQAMYQLLAVLKTDSGSQGRVLENGDQPSRIVQQSESPIQFHLHLFNSNPGPSPLLPSSTQSSLGTPSSQTSSNNLIRVHYQLQHGVQSFVSLIITPNMTAKEVLELAVSKALPSEPTSNFSLMLATSKGDIIQIRDDDYPYTMSNSLNRFELKRRTATNPLLPPHPPSTSHTSPATPLSTSSVSHLTTPSYAHDLSTSQLLKGKVQLHGELIEALRELTSQSQVGGLLETSSGQSRETVLEQALVEQNQILDVMQDLVSTLESENLHYRESITAQNKLVHSLSGWEVKALEVERELEQLSQRQQDMQVAELKKQLEEKNQTIVTLQSRLQSESGNSNSLLMAKLSSTRTKLETERVRCIELEEKVSEAKDDLSRMKRKMAENESIVTSKESEIQHVKYEIASLRTFEEQQQELVMKQRTSLANQDIQLSSLTRALNKEKKVADQLRRLQLSTSTLLPRVRDASVESLDSDSPPFPFPFQPSFFEQISDREIHTVELSRIASETELGFSFSKVDLPISSQVPCLIVKAVKESSIAEGWLEPGDELVEVNGIACRSARQSRAVRMLEQAVGLLKLVVAREPKVRSNKLQYNHSTPKIPNGPDFSANDQDTGGGNRTALWATALSPTKIESFSVVETEPGANSNAEFVTVPEVYSISVAKESEGSVSGDQLDSSEVASQEKPSVDEYGKLSVSSSLVTLNSREETARRKYQSEIAELQDQLDESEHIRLSLETELNSTRDEAGHLQEDYQVAKAENQELQHQVLNYESEMGNVSKHISDLQTALMTLQAQVTDEQQKLASMDNLNRVISGELVEAKDTASQAVKVRETLEQELKSLKEDLEKKEETTNMVHELEMENDRLVSEIDRMGGEASKLRNTLESCKKSYEDTIIELKQKQKELESQLEVARKVSESSTLSSQEEYQHLTAQLKSAKSLLKEAEMKDSQQKVEMRYLKQAADLANNELKKLETECQKIKEELSFFKQQAESDTIELQSLTLNLKNTQMKLEAKQAIIERLRGEGDGLRRTNSKLKTENFELNEYVKKMEVDLKVSSMEEERLIEKLGAMEAEKDDIFQQLESSLDESNELSIQVEQATSRLQELEEEKSVKLEAKATAQDEMMKSKTSEAKLQHEVEVSQRKVEQLTQQAAKMKEELKQLEGKSDTATKALIQAQTKNEQLTSVKDELHKQLSELQDTHATLSKEMEARELEMADTRSALLKAQEQAKVGEERLEESRLKVAKLESELKAAEEEKAKTESKAASLEFIQAQDQSNIEELKKSQAEKDQEIQRIGDQIEQLNTLVQKIKVEQTALTSLQTATQHQLEESQKAHLGEVADLKEKVASKQRQLSLQNDELNAQESRSEMLRDKIEHLSVSLEKMDMEKAALNSSMDMLTLEKSELQSQNAQLQSRLTHLKSELDRLTMSTDSLSSETAGLRKQSREYEKELDQLTAQLQVTEMNLEIATRSLKDSEEMNSTQSENMANLEALLQATQSKLKELETSLEKTSMELFTKQEELSKASAGLKLRQTECTQLQESLIAVQAKADSYKEQSSELEAEKERLLLQISQLETVEKNLQESLVQLKEEKTNDAQQYSDEIEKRQKEIEAFQLKEKAHEEESATLQTSLEEARASITQLLSAQEETKKSISKIGDEKDRDIINLREEVETLKSQVDTLTGTLTASSKSQDLLKEEMDNLQQNEDALQQRLSQEAEEANKLKEELKVHRETEAELEKLNSRVTTLDENLKEKSRKIAELESECHSTESQLESVKSKNSALLEKAVELSELKISMAEQEKALDELQKTLAETETAHKQILEERTQLLSRVREFEVQKHAAQNQPEPTTQSRASSPAEEEESRDISTILLSLHQMEEEVARTRAYTENLLINIMTSAPFLLEKLN